MIPVETSGTILEEMHVDGSTTASMFIASGNRVGIARSTSRFAWSQYLRDCERTIRSSNHHDATQDNSDCQRGIQASLHSSTRGAVLATLALAMRNDMHFNVTAIPDDYPYTGLLDLKPERMRALFTFGADCAMRGELWTTPEGLPSTILPGLVDSAWIDPRVPRPVVAAHAGFLPDKHVAVDGQPAQSDSRGGE